MARRALWRSGAAKDAVPRIAHLDRDRPLVEAAQRDPAGFDALYRRYLARVYSYAYYELGDHHAAEDATEATFVSALTNLHRFEERARPADGDGASTFRVWLFRIARHCWLDARRKSRAQRKVPMPMEMPGSQVGPLTEMIAGEMEEKLKIALELLPSKYRAAYLLWTQEELPYAEIAGILGVSEETARWRVCKARQSLVQTMTSYWHCNES